MNNKENYVYGCGIANTKGCAGCPNSDIKNGSFFCLLACDWFQRGQKKAQKELKQEAIKWIKVMIKEDWDNDACVTDTWKEFFNITEEDLKGDEK